MPVMSDGIWSMDCTLHTVAYRLFNTLPYYCYYYYVCDVQELLCVIDCILLSTGNTGGWTMLCRNLNMLYCMLASVVSDNQLCYFNCVGNAVHNMSELKYCYLVLYVTRLRWLKVKPSPLEFRIEEYCISRITFSQTELHL